MNVNKVERLGKAFYMYDAESLELIDVYESIAACCRDNGLSGEAINSKSYRKPLGFYMEGAIYSRVNHGTVLPGYIAKAEYEAYKMPRCLDDEEKAYIERNWNRAISNVAKELGRSYWSVWNYLKKTGLWEKRCV